MHFFGSFQAIVCALGWVFLLKSLTFLLRKEGSKLLGCFVRKYFWGYFCFLKNCKSSVQFPKSPCNKRAANSNATGRVSFSEYEPWQYLSRSFLFNFATILPPKTYISSSFRCLSLHQLQQISTFASGKYFFHQNHHVVPRFWRDSSIWIQLHELIRHWSQTFWVQIFERKIFGQFGYVKFVADR